MPDISMCHDDECPFRTNCYRHEASGTRPAILRQAYFMNSPRVGNMCVHFWPQKDDGPMADNLAQTIVKVIDHYQTEPEEPEIGTWEQGYKAAVKDMSMALLAIVQAEAPNEVQAIINRVAERE